MGVGRLGWLDLYECSVCVCVCVCVVVVVVVGGYIYKYDVRVVGEGGQDRGSLIFEYV